MFLFHCSKARQISLLLFAGLFFNVLGGLVALSVYQSKQNNSLLTLSKRSCL